MRQLNTGLQTENGMKVAGPALGPGWGDGESTLSLPSAHPTAPLRRTHSLCRIPLLPSLGFWPGPLPRLELIPCLSNPDLGGWRPELINVCKVLQRFWDPGAPDELRRKLTGRGGEKGGSRPGPGTPGRGDTPTTGGRAGESYEEKVQPLKGTPGA